MTVLLLCLLLLNITFVLPASLQGEEKEHTLRAEMDISVSLSFSLCDNIECKHGGTCFQGRCLCPAKTTGAYCEENPCERNPCFADENCFKTEEGYVCDCPAGDTGTDCGVIQSPNHPQSYNNSMEMTWNISGISDKYIQLQFEDVFEIEVTRTDTCENVLNYAISCDIYDDEDTDCFDYIQIVSENIFVKYCGGAPPAPITAQDGNSVSIFFKSDSACSFSGFKLSYRYVDPIPPVNPIMSPSYPTEYPDYTYMTWLVPGRDGFNITFTFNGVFNLPYGLRDESDCFIIDQRDTCFDYVKINNNRYCGDNKPEPIAIPNGEDALVTFKTDDSCGFEGFSMTYVYQEIDDA